MRVIRSLPCDAELLGNRDYLHSTTIMRSLQACQDAFDIGQWQHITAQFHDLTSRQCTFDVLSLEGNETLTRLGYVATFRIRGKQGEAMVGLRPLEAPITRQRAFDEDALSEGAMIDLAGRSICQPRFDGPVLQTVVSLNKRLHAALFSDEGYGKWLLTRLELNTAYFAVQTPAQMCLRVISELAAINTKAGIEVDGNLLGYVHFSRKKEAA